MPRPSAPAHPVGAKWGMMAWLWDKEKGELCKGRTTSGSPIRHPRWAVGLGAQWCHQQDPASDPGVWARSHTAPFCSAVLGGG